MSEMHFVDFVKKFVLEVSYFSSCKYLSESTVHEIQGKDITYFRNRLAQLHSVHQTSDDSRHHPILYNLNIIPDSTAELTDLTGIVEIYQTSLNLPGL